MSHFMMNKKSFSLLEIMMVLVIIGMLAAMGIQNFLRAKISANDALAKSTLSGLSKAAETYAWNNTGKYPLDMTSLTGSTPPYVHSDPCYIEMAGFTYVCFLSNYGYNFMAYPVTPGVTGTSSYSIVTGGVTVDW